MDALAVVSGATGAAPRALLLTPRRRGRCVVQSTWSGVSTGTERLLWSGRMPPFPGMGYPLVPGYESVGRVVEAGPAAGSRIGEHVFVPGAHCFGEVRGLFGGAASRLVVPAARRAARSAARRTRHPAGAGRDRLPCARAARAAASRDLIVGHGVLGRLLARLRSPAGGAPPVVWERNRRAQRARIGYAVIDPDRRCAPRLRVIYDVSGDAATARHADRRGSRQAARSCSPDSTASRCRFAFPPAFMREARIRVAARMAAGRSRRRHGADRDRRAVARRSDHPRRDAHGRARTPTAPRSTIPPA